MGVKQILIFPIIVFFLITATAIFAQESFIFNHNNGDFRIVYQAQTILKGELKVEVNGIIHSLENINAQINYRERRETGPNNGIMKIGSFRLEAPENGNLIFQGTIQGKDAFSANPGEQNNHVIRAVSGFSKSRLNTGIYSRKNDWALLFNGAEEKSFEFTKSIGEMDVFNTRVKGRTFEVYFKPDYYRTHLGLSYFNPSNFNIVPEQPMGWISWKACQATVTEQNIHDAADWCASNLRQFGLTHIILDDGWFIGSKGSALYHVPKNVNWTKGNERFSSGMKSLADYIHQTGFKAGIWLSPFGISNEDIMAEHPNWWVRQSKNGSWAESNSGWHGPYFADGSIDSAVRGWILKGITAMNQAGYDFFKIDGQMHVAHEAYEQGSDYFKSKGITWQQVYRQTWQSIMNSVSGKFVLSCWSRIPENIGNPHAIRIGGDKDAGWEYGPKGTADDLAKYLYEHNICWIDDPDHIVLGGCTLAESRSWTSLVGLTGTMFTFSDIPQNLSAEKVEMYRKILPTINTRPLELYKMTSTPPLWCLEVNRDFDNWLVVAKTCFSDAQINKIDFAELGLDPSKEYMVYDFWKKQLLGVFSKEFTVNEPQEHDVNVYCIRQKRDYPWVVSVDRHISQGGISLKGLSYNDSTRTLSGTSKVVPNFNYNVTIYKPEEVHYRQISLSSGDYKIDISQPSLIDLNMISANDTLINWRISFQETK